jgi:pilus assembly protein CpaE
MRRPDTQLGFAGDSAIDSENGPLVMSAPLSQTESISMGAELSVVLIGPNDARRRNIAQAFNGPQSRVTRELARYPAIDDLSQIFERNHDVALVDLDGDSEKALDVVENLCSADGSLTVIVYSATANSDLLVRCMRAGAREFLTEPISPNSVAEALVRAALRRDEVRRVRKALGKLFVFAGAKGGAGVTTLASNFALSLAKDSGGKAALLDLDLHLGDAALNLGLTSKYSAADALEHMSRLDSDFLGSMMARHTSGLAVLCAPDGVSTMHPNRVGVEKLVRVARETFDYVVVDADTLSPDVMEALFQTATTVYLVTQVALAELRNANRLLARYFSGPNSANVEIVLNRFEGRSYEIDEPTIQKALTRPAKWSIPDDYRTVRRAQNTGVPIVLEDSPLAQRIRNMARVASGQAPVDQKKKRFGLFG